MGNDKTCTTVIGMNEWPYSLYLKITPIPSERAFNQFLHKNLSVQKRCGRGFSTIFCTKEKCIFGIFQPENAQFFLKFCYRTCFQPNFAVSQKKFNPETEELCLPNQPKSNTKTSEKPAGSTKPAGKDNTDNNMDREMCVKTIRELRKNISNKDMNQKIGALCNTVDSITAYINSHPDTAPQVRTLDDYYLPTVIKLVRAYADLESLQRKTREIKKTEEDIVRAIENAQNSFDSILSGLVEGVAEDARAEAAAMQTKMEMDGIISSQGQDIFQGQTLTQAEEQW